MRGVAGGGGLPNFDNWLRGSFLIWEIARFMTAAEAVEYTNTVLCVL